MRPVPGEGYRRRRCWRRTATDSFPWSRTCWLPVGSLYPIRRSGCGRRNLAGISPTTSVVPNPAARSGISASSLSDAVQRLERAAGIRLFAHTTRNVVLTEAGQRLLDQLRPALAEVASAFNGLAHGDEAAGTLKLDVPRIVARYILPSDVSRVSATRNNWLPT